MADQFSKMYDVERVGGDQRTRLAEMLRANALNAPQGQMVGNWYVKPSWTQNLAHLANTAVGVFGGAALEEEKKQQIADILRNMQEGVPVENKVQNFNRLETMGEGQTAIPQQEPQNALQRLTQQPQRSTEQSNINPAMVPVQPQQYRPLTQDEQDMQLLKLAQIDPQMGAIYGNLLGTRAAREEKRQQAIELEKLRQEGKLDYLKAAQLMRQPPQPQAPVAVIDPKTGQEVFVSPSQAYGMRPAKSMQPLSVAQQKEVLEADETAQSSQNVINTLEAAKKLNPIAYSGIGAKERAIIRSNTPFMGESKEANATIQLENMTLGTALENLKSIFGGNPTEGERKILVDLQASPSKTVEQRAEILDRAKAAAENRLRFNIQKAEAIRGGSYMRPGYSPVTAPQQAGGLPSQSAIDAEIERRRQGR